MRSEERHRSAQRKSRECKSRTFWHPAEGNCDKLHDSGQTKKSESDQRIDRERFEDGLHAFALPYVNGQTRRGKREIAVTAADFLCAGTALNRTGWLGSVSFVVLTGIENLRATLPRIRRRDISR